MSDIYKCLADFVDAVKWTTRLKYTNQHAGDAHKHEMARAEQSLNSTQYRLKVAIDSLKDPGALADGSVIGKAFKAYYLKRLDGATTCMLKELEAGNMNEVNDWMGEIQKIRAAYKKGLQGVAEVDAFARELGGVEEQSNSAL